MTMTNQSLMVERDERGWTRRTGVSVAVAGRGFPAPAWDGSQGWTSATGRPVAVIDVHEDDTNRPGMVLVMKLVITATMLAVSAMAGAWVGQLT